ncbi:MAG: SIMPL domain-containing protein [Planctomycetota bacterium]
MRRLIALLVVLSSCSLAVRAQEVVIEAEPATLTVQGVGVVEAEPTQVTVTVGVEETAESASGAQRRVSAKMRRIIAKIKLLGLDNAVLQTASIQLYPKHSPKRERIVGYTASSSLRIRFDEPDRTGDVIDNAIETGANANVSIRFGLANDGPARAEALKRAIAAARENAETIAAASGVSIVKTYKIADQYARPTPRMALERASFDAATPIETGEVGVTATVTIVYIIEDKDAG